MCSYHNGNSDLSGILLRILMDGFFSPCRYIYPCLSPLTTGLRPMNACDKRLATAIPI